MKFYKILPRKDSPGKVYVPREMYDMLFSTEPGKISIHAGLRMQTADLECSGMDTNEITIGADLLNNLSIPIDIPYQVQVEGDSLILGPVVGLLMVRRKRGLNRRVLGELMDYTRIYNNTGGVLCVFSLEGIDFENSLVKGYYYNPNSDRVWVKAILPLPGAIYRRAVISKSAELRLKRITNNKLFNSSYFNKWEFWEMVSGAPSISGNIPYTRLYETSNDLDLVIKMYGMAYLKPINGTLARGIIKISLDKGIYYARESHDSTATAIYSREELQEYIDENIGRQQYLVQQGLKPIMVNGRFLDLRVIMQKDGRMEWVCTGIIGFLGSRGGICSNWGTQSKFEHMFQSLLHYSPEEVLRKKWEIIDVCKNVCKVLEPEGENYGDLGFDVLVDESSKVWVLEVNKKHYHDVPLWAGDVETYNEVKSNPIRYAAALSGFEDM